LTAVVSKNREIADENNGAGKINPFDFPVLPALPALPRAVARPGPGFPVPVLPALPALPRAVARPGPGPGYAQG